MTEIEKIIIHELKHNRDNVKIFWDMDGTCASMEMQNKEHKLEEGFFYTKRPIKSIIKIMKKLQEKGAETYILSFCSFNYQREDKLKWLNEYCSFIKSDNVIIIPRKEEKIKVIAEKQYLKAEYMKKYISEHDVVYMIDDNEVSLLGTKEKLPYINIVSPIDFIE